MEQYKLFVYCHKHVKAGEPPPYKQPHMWTLPFSLTTNIRQNLFPTNSILAILSSF